MFGIFKKSKAERQAKASEIVNRSFKDEAMPPYIGMDAPTVDEAYRRYNPKISEVWRTLKGFKDSEKDQVYDRVIRRFIEYVGNLPGSSRDEYHHNHEWGLLEHSLEVALHAVNWMKNHPVQVMSEANTPDRVAMGKIGPRNNLLVLMGALCHDIGKVMDVEIKSAIGEKWSVEKGPFTKWLEHQGSDGYHYCWKEGRGIDHERRGVYFMHKIFDVDGLDFIQYDRYMQLVTMLTGGPNMRETLVYKVVHEADKRSVKEYKLGYRKALLAQEAQKVDDMLSSMENKLRETELEVELEMKEYEAAQPLPLAQPQVDAEITSPIIEEPVKNNPPVPPNKSEPETVMVEKPKVEAPKNNPAVIHDPKPVPAKTANPPAQSQKVTPKPSGGGLAALMSASNDDNMEEEFDPDAIVGAEARGEEVGYESSSKAEAKEPETSTRDKTQSEPEKTESEPDTLSVGLSGVSVADIDAEKTHEMVEVIEEDKSAKKPDWYETMDLRREFLQGFGDAYRSGELKVNCLDGSIWVGTDYTMMIFPQGFRDVYSRNVDRIMLCEGCHDLVPGKKDKPLVLALNALGVVWDGPDVDHERCIWPIRFKPKETNKWFKKKDVQDQINMLFFKNEFLWQGLDLPPVYPAFVILGEIRHDEMTNKKKWFQLMHFPFSLDPKLDEAKLEDDPVAEKDPNKKTIGFSKKNAHWLCDEMLELVYQRKISVSIGGSVAYLSSKYLIVVFPRILSVMSKMEEYSQFNWPSKSEISEMSLVLIDHIKDYEKILKSSTGHVQRQFIYTQKNMTFGENDLKRTPIRGLAFRRDAIDEKKLDGIKTVKVKFRDFEVEKNDDSDSKQ